MLGLKLNHVSKRSHWCRWMNWRVWVNKSCLTNLITNPSSTTKPRAHLIHNIIEQRPAFIQYHLWWWVHFRKHRMHFHIVYFLKVEIVQVVEILSGLFFIANTMAPDIWRHKERGHQQSCYWPNSSLITGLQNLRAPPTHISFSYSLQSILLGVWL